MYFRNLDEFAVGTILISWASCPMPTFAQTLSSFEFFDKLEAASWRAQLFVNGLLGFSNNSFGMNILT